MSVTNIYNLCGIGVYVKVHGMGRHGTDLNNMGKNDVKIFIQNKVNVLMT